MATNVMTTNITTTTIPVPQQWQQNAIIKSADYQRMYDQSIADPERFWSAEAEKFLWREKWRNISSGNFTNISQVAIKWFEGAKLNISENCLDRHLPQRAEQTALIWEGDNPDQSQHISYGELYDKVCRFANILRKRGVRKGDRVTIYLPMIPEAAIALLACARIGAVHSVVFAGFSAEALAGRIADCQSRHIITVKEGKRGGKIIPLLANVEEALLKINSPCDVLIVANAEYEKMMREAAAECPPEITDSEDPLFILYTSGSTGKPKGVLHTVGGYMVWSGMTFRYTFDYKTPEQENHENNKNNKNNKNQKNAAEIFWCSADIGWITGHSYCLYGPLLNGATSLIFEGVPHYPDFSRFWQIIDKHQVNIFYTAPTAIRALMREGDEFVKRSSRRSLRLIGSVGEPINPEAWLWYWRVVGEERCPVIDTWWQTETGGHMITSFPGAHAMKPGSAAFPYFGIQPVIVNAQGEVQHGACEGMLCIKSSWPGQARTVYGDHARFVQTYFSQFPGLYFTGDGAKRDEEGYYWITGRIDDVLNISGHRIGTAEIESALVGHANVTEAAVVGFPHDIKGQGIYCYVTLENGIEGNAETITELKKHVRKIISPIATPDIIHFTTALPKTRSGKIMRRILRKIAEGDTGNLGDISTLTNPEIVAELIKGRVVKL